MSILKILRMGHPILRQTATTVDLKQIQTADFRRLLENMIDTLENSKGIGLAAPQIGVSLQLALIEIKPGQASRYGSLPVFPRTFFINPTIEKNSNHCSGYWEGCLSVPGIRGYVVRPNNINIKYWDLSGQFNEINIEGFLATVVQHELDHLAGKLFIDRIHDSQQLSFNEEFDKFISPGLNKNIQ